LNPYQKIDPELLKDLIKNSGCSFKESAASFIFNCPKCGKDKLYINKERGNWICFKCASEGLKGSRPEYILNQLLNSSISQIKESLYGIEHSATMFLDLKFKDIWNTDQEAPEEIPTVTWPDYFVDHTSPKFQKGRDYLINQRGLTEEHIVRYDLKFNPQWNTVVFPVSFEGQLYGWQERGIYNSFKFTSKGFKKAQMLMFQDNLLISDHAILCEGPVDALKCHILGGAVAAMGKGVSKTQLDLIESHCSRVYIALDPDAYVEVGQICKDLSDIEVYIMTPPKNREDFGKCTESEVIEQFNKAVKWEGQILL
jgi:ribosomal protein L37AE/L43A